MLQLNNHSLQSKHPFIGESVRHSFAAGAYLFNQMESQEEIWMPIKGWEGIYKISNKGVVVRLKRQLKQTKRKSRGKPPTDLIVSTRIDNVGYLSLSLYRFGKTYTKRIHQLLAIAFLQHTPDGLKGKVVDHIDKNKLNNNLYNLRVVSRRTNSCNTISITSSKYRGVSWNKRKNKWDVRIYYNNKNIFLGNYTEELDAANAYENYLKYLND